MRDSARVYLSGDCRPIPALNFAREKLRTNFTAEKAQIRVIIYLTRPLV